MAPFFHGHAHVPPGFRFHPTDEELVGYYLYKKLSSETMDMDIIQEVDLYKMEPWDMIDKYTSSSSSEQLEWYFFSHKDKKYPTGTRTNRATTAGFWKATGRDKAIHTKFKLIGMRKTLVFYKGRAPNGQKTDWIMHEYRLEDEHSNGFGSEDGWVVCRMFKKRPPQRTCGGQPSASYSYDEQVNEMNTSLNDLNNTSNGDMSDMNNTGALANMFTYRNEVSYRNEASGSRQEQPVDEHRAFQDAFGQLPHLESYE